MNAAEEKSPMVSDVRPIKDRGGVSVGAYWLERDGVHARDDRHSIETVHPLDVTQWKDTAVHLAENEAFAAVRTRVLCPSKAVALHIEEIVALHAEGIRLILETSAPMTRERAVISVLRVREIEARIEEIERLIRQVSS